MGIFSEIVEIYSGTAQFCGFKKTFAVLASRGH